MSSSTVQQRRRKPRVVYTQQEVNFLESEYFHCRDPDRHVRLRIAHDLGKDVDEITTWFKNRRSRVRPAKKCSVVLPENHKEHNCVISNNLSAVETNNDLDLVLETFNLNKRARKERYTFTKQQIQGLESEFTKCRTPDHTKKDVMAKKWGLTRSIVSNWFKNRRTKAKKEASKENTAPPPIITHQPPVSIDQSPPVSYQQPPAPTLLGPVTSRDQPQLPPSPPMESYHQQSIPFEPQILYQPLMPIQPALMEPPLPIELPMSPTSSSSSSYTDFSHCLSTVLNNYNEPVISSDQPLMSHQPLIPIEPQMSPNNAMIDHQRNRL
ncbi:cone-rod homeobox protein-like [Tetranychus urticae]|uniref:cone-rod homeobox protein-like n=1 Tax=Tetranychus urticae TaxID=32264 RepID=UPI000D65A45E|nr:cone-rod homeobox protein-like [Tetranychus urticae]XP_025017341.1 cone-rod homeobox protein-like [Tetranychus urticae]